MTADAKFYDYQRGTAAKLVPLVGGDYAEAVLLMQALVPTNYDSIYLSYTGANLTGVQYYLNNVLLVTLTLTYDGSNNMTSVVRA